MGLGQLFTRAINYDVTNTVTGETANYVVFGDNPLAPLWPTADYRGAMGLPGVWRASVLLSDLLGSIPWHAYQESTDGTAEKISAPLLEQPAPPDSRMSTFSALALDLLFHGNAVAIYAARDAEGIPTRLVPVSADMVGVERNRVTGDVEYEINGQTYQATDVLHVKGPSKPGCLRGMGVLETHFDTLTLVSDQARQARSVTNSGVPTGLLKSDNPDLNQTEADDLKAKWLRSQRDRTVAVLNATTSFTPLAWNPQEAQLLEARDFSLKEIGLIFGLPHSVLGATNGSSMTYSNIETEALNLIKFSLAGHLARFEQALSLAFPFGTWVKANLDSLLRSDTLSRYQAHQIALTSGFMTVDEVRELEDLGPISGPTPSAEARAVIGNAKALHDYWTKGEGLAKWVESPKPFTTLYTFLLEYMEPQKARATTAKWFEDVFGFPPSSREGKNPVGPG